MIRLTMTAFALAATGVALAKLPPPDEAAKAKAAETAAKSAWQAKVDTWLLCKVQDKLAARYKSNHPATQATAAASAASPAASGAAAAAAMPASAVAAAAPASAAKPPATAAPAAKPATASASSATSPTAASASQGGSTPLASVASPNAIAIPSCADPGPFAYAPPEQKPLETSEAHSPAANATSPPSVRTESGTMTSGKTGAPTGK